MVKSWHSDIKASRKFISDCSDKLRKKILEKVLQDRKDMVIYWILLREGI